MNEPTVTCSNPGWIPVSLLSTDYPKGDLIGKGLAHVSCFSPFIIICGLITLILFRRDLHTITLFIGLMLNELCNLILKQWIAEPRPSFHNLDRIHVKYGMPSNHSQLMYFFAVYISCFLLIRLSNKANDRVWRILLTLSVIVWATLVAFSRVYLKYHTVEQVIWGGITGSTTAVLWFILVHCFLSSYFPYITSLKVCKMLLIRDTTNIPNVILFEYTALTNKGIKKSK